MLVTIVSSLLQTVLEKSFFLQTVGQGNVGRYYLPVCKYTNEKPVIRIYFSNGEVKVILSEKKRNENFIKVSFNQHTVINPFPHNDTF